MKAATQMGLPARDDLLERDARQFYAALSELIRFYQFRDRDRICCYGLSVSQCYMLDALIRRGPLTLNELAGQLYLDKSTASRVVDGLVRKGYVARKPHPQDGRALQLHAAPAGRKLHRRIVDGILAEERALLADFPLEVCRAMSEMMRRLTRAAVARAQKLCAER